MLCSLYLTAGIDKINNAEPERLILNLTDEPDRSIAVTWRTKILISDARVELIKSDSLGNFLGEKSDFNPSIDTVIIDSQSQSFSYSAVLNNLEPGTRYFYRVGADNGWSEWNKFTTADHGGKQFSFLYFGDVQHGIKEFAPRIFRKGFQTAPEAKFWIFTGDLVDRAEIDRQWEFLFEAAGFIPRITPWMISPGNHEYPDTVIDEKEISYLDKSFNQHFTLPENGLKELIETSYSFDYVNTKFIVLNGNEKLYEQSLWLDSVLSTNQQKWVIAVIHQPLYSMGKKRDQRKTRDAFLNVLDRHHVDLVLQGHDHVYARSHKLYDGNIIDEDSRGTVYITSVSGIDGYSLNPLYSGLMEKTGADKQLFQKITVDGGELNCYVYTTTGEVFDYFHLKK